MCGLRRLRRRCLRLCGLRLCRLCLRLRRLCLRLCRLCRLRLCLRLCRLCRLRLCLGLCRRLRLCLGRLYRLEGDHLFIAVFL